MLAHDHGEESACGIMNAAQTIRSFSDLNQELHVDRRRFESAFSTGSTRKGTDRHGCRIFVRQAEIRLKPLYFSSNLEASAK
jgi:hypothetical protein